MNQTKLEQIIDVKLVRAWSKTLASSKIHSGGYDSLKLPSRGRTLIYLDPPYRDSFTNYSTGFGDAEQIKLIQWYRDQVAKGHKVIESNRAEIGDTFFEDRLGDIADIHFLDVTYTAGRRKKTETGFEAKPAREVLIIYK